MAFKLSYGFSAALHAGLQPLKVAALEWQAARCLWPRQVGLRLPISGDPSGRARGPLIVVHRAGGAIRGIAADLDWLQSRNGFSSAWRRLGAMLDILSAEGVADGDWLADLSDHATADEPVLAFSSRHPSPLLVPDRGFVRSRGYARERRVAAAAPAFTDRDASIVWRGSPSGQGDLVGEPLAATDHSLRQRVRLCLALRDLANAPDAWGHAADVDAKIVLWGGAAPDVAEAYRTAGILGPAIPQRSWCRRRFAIDIDGNSNAFSNLFIRLLYGCCVIKVASPLGFRQWYYDRLEPWVHYVPVAADLSDLVDTIVWCQSHPSDCRDIAAAGQRLAMGMTVESERRAVVAEIGRRQSMPRVA